MAVCAACGNALPRSPTHAAARLRLRARQCWPRHAGAAGLVGAQEHPAHGALHRALAGSVQFPAIVGKPNARDFADSSVATRTPGCE
jgi:hypothetical protein